MDLSHQKDPGSVDPSARESSDSAEADELKSCDDCRTTRTPLWRGGPNGPKSLCNACGIRYRKKRRESKGVEGLGMKMKVLGLKKKWKQRIMGEEEQAAVLLMALSSGLLYA
ncbi:GATA transcription factor 16-like isoform X3 [Asparagus officinalis]|uniref:GATA transcription factor 16-like isoform X2 n=1 Tax=Asparagus officinalis TaxID=4686 RepID=UPI00098E463C|nr:GATA transcription factor 16-like isoform X2 [Asparagus officinalis]XP_020254911.1 GATA transcription factor 16-like isoform X3 [Asparagus officinalis]